MAMRYASRGITITGTGAVVFPHGLPATPDEYAVVNHIAASQAQFITAGSTNIQVSAGPGGAQVSVFGSVNQTIIQ